MGSLPDSHDRLCIGSAATQPTRIPDIVRQVTVNSPDTSYNPLTPHSQPMLGHRPIHRQRRPRRRQHPHRPLGLAHPLRHPMDLAPPNHSRMHLLPRITHMARLARPHGRRRARRPATPDEQSQHRHAHSTRDRRLTSPHKRHRKTLDQRRRLPRVLQRYQSPENRDRRGSMGHTANVRARPADLRHRLLRAGWHELDQRILHGPGSVRARIRGDTAVLATDQRLWPTIYLPHRPGQCLRDPDDCGLRQLG